MTKSTITRERLQELAEGQSGFNLRTATHEESQELARMALAAMDSSESVELPLDYLQGHKDGLEWAARLAEANHPDTGDWLYDDPIELAKAIRKGPDMPPSQPVADSEPVAWTDEQELRDVDRGGCGYLFTVNPVTPHADERRIILLYRHAQPAPVVPNGLRLALSNAGIAAPESDEMLAATCEKHIQALVTWVKDRKPFQSAPVVPSFEEWLSAANRKPLGWVKDAMREAYDACRAAMLQELKKSAGTEAICRSDENVQVLHTKSPAQSDCCPAQNSVTPAQNQGWIPVSERMPEDRTQVILWDAEIGEVTSGHYSHKTQTFYHCGDAIENEITHWMLPPCAPQEVK
ncbi:MULTISPECIES: DUF551 domain-containing protein [unclassified Klebsiella]|nr:DUF551 domain-containing protein [Klebsiella sp. K5-1]MDK1844518.1 DUF551 domain-containing protein [Klebsiella sp. K5-1]MDK1941435.1 DUF551 domain-containing protein [Klebsiella sp. K4-32]MDK1969787.1 DUF551 domain-containing protein [Klebsiella sp. K5-45]MDK2001095.1 DUF551 domain-containing protein [Klebsiella sp. K4-44]